MISGTRFIGLIVLLQLTAACGSQPAVAPPSSLVVGTVAAGPVSPLARPGVPATRPVRGATVDALRGNQVVAVARTDAAGRYELRLQPGTYLIVAKSDLYLSRTTSRNVTISAGQTVTASFVIDTGIR